MKWALLGIFLCGVLAGCANLQQPSTGNFAPNVPAEANARFVVDSLTQLTALYPPAHTQLNLEQKAEDAFGVSLVEALRAKGYAVLEFKPLAEDRFLWSSARSAAGQHDGLGLSYVVDQPGAGDIYRVVLTVGGRTLTRAYLAHNQTALPAGAWLRKE
ncbi:conjugal transfer protein TrbH (plasmid) [Variovorax sp. SRS16]|uniref:conjugal transfer protein TrbH n=1 Tax=Variovorax sp. SRS16 TaxID=282217 RepID=UPI001316AEC2|nr:conjugal transfer protein TrbH [Variovorax sp. SRS16]VTU46201.1 conjugal transfer protein TrbH [Variovorax sp. SRS16]